MKQVVLAFSGGLDTSFCVPYLEEMGYQVTAVTVDTGGFTAEDIAAIEARAKQVGVTTHHTIDGRQEVWDKAVAYIIKGNILRGGVYPLCAGPERLIQASKVAEIAVQIGADAVAHGSTGAGNDQVRFDLAIRIIAPGTEVIAPIRELGLTRQQEIEFLEGHGYDVPTISQDYSINKGVLGTTIGGKETLGSWELPPDEVYPTVVPIATAPAEGKTIIIDFEDGLPTRLDDVPMSGLDIALQLNTLGAEHGVGKGMHLGNTIIGIKGRVAFEAPAMSILIQAHRELEKLVLSKNQSFWKDHLATVYGDMLHEGQYFDPVMRDIEALMDSSQGRVSGQVKVKLQQGNVIVIGVASPYSLMDARVATYGEENFLWDGQDAEGFCKLYGLQSVLVQRASQPKEVPA